MSDKQQFTLQEWYEQEMDFCKTCKQQMFKAQEEYHNTLSDLDWYGALLQVDKYSELLMALSDARRKCRKAVADGIQKRSEMKNELEQILAKIQNGENEK